MPFPRPTRQQRGRPSVLPNFQHGCPFNSLIVIYQSRCCRLTWTRWCVPNSPGFISRQSESRKFPINMVKNSKFSQPQCRIQNFHNHSAGLKNFTTTVQDSKFSEPQCRIKKFYNHSAGLKNCTTTVQD